MASVVRAKIVRGRKLWYISGAAGDARREKTYPGVTSRSQFYDVLAAELGLPRTSTRWDVVSTLMHKTWNGAAWVDDSVMPTAGSAADPRS